MRKIIRVLNNQNPNFALEINPIPVYRNKIRIFQDESFYYKINIATEVRPLSISLKLDEG